MAVDSAVFSHPGKRRKKEVVGIDHVFCFSLVLGSARRPTDTAFRNFTEPMKAFAEMSGGTAAVWKCIRSIRSNEYFTQPANTVLKLELDGTRITITGPAEEEKSGKRGIDFRGCRHHFILVLTWRALADPES